MIIVGTRTPLPSEEERYLDFLLMVREAMLEILAWQSMGRMVGPDANLARVYMETNVSLFSRGMTGQLSMDSFAVNLARVSWTAYTEDKDTRAAVSQTAAAFTN